MANFKLQLSNTWTLVGQLLSLIPRAEPLDLLVTRAQLHRSRNFYSGHFIWCISPSTAIPGPRQPRRQHVPLVSSGPQRTCPASLSEMTVPPSPVHSLCFRKGTPLKSPKEHSQAVGSLLPQSGAILTSKLPELF